jgi:exonuclease SbcD
MSRDESRNKTLDQIRREVEKRLTDMLLAEVKNLDPELPSFLCAHVTAAGSVTSSEQSMMLGSDHVIGISTLANPAFDYVALGHVHKHQILNANPMVVYPGSLERVDFSEENDTKGFCILEIDVLKPAGQRLSDFNFERVNARPMMTLDIHVNDNEDPTEATLEAISKKGVDALVGVIVRVRVELSAHTEPAFREDVVRRALVRAHYLTGIEKTVRRRDQRTRLDSELAEGLSPVEALKSYFQSKNISGHRERVLTELGEQLIQEELEKE